MAFETFDRFLALLARRLGASQGSSVLHSEPSVAKPRSSRPYTLAEIVAAGTGGLQVQCHGARTVGVNAGSSGAARLGVSLGRQPASANSDEWIFMVPTSVQRSPDGRAIDEFWVRAFDTAVPSSATELVVFDLDPAELGASVAHGGRFPTVGALGAALLQIVAQTLAGAPVNVVASDEGALASSGWNGTAYARFRALAAALGDAAAIPAGVQQVAAALQAYNGATYDRIRNGAGTAAAALRATLASDDPAVTSLATLVARATDAGAAVATALRFAPATTATAVPSRGTAIVTSAVIAAANARRKSLLITNLSTTEDIVVNFAAAAVAATHYPIAAGDSLEVTSVQEVRAIRGAAADAAFALLEESY